MLKKQKHHQNFTVSNQPFKIPFQNNMCHKSRSDCILLLNRLILLLFYYRLMCKNGLYLDMVYF